MAISEAVRDPKTVFCILNTEIRLIHVRRVQFQKHGKQLSIYNSKLPCKNRKRLMLVFVVFKEMRSIKEITLAHENTHMPRKSFLQSCPMKVYMPRKSLLLAWFSPCSENHSCSWSLLHHHISFSINDSLFLQFFIAQSSLSIYSKIYLYCI